MTPHNITANGLFNPFTNRKRWQITCGKCLHTWTEKLPPVEPQSAICPNPNCREQNVWSLRKFMEGYDRIKGGT